MKNVFYKARKEHWHDGLVINTQPCQFISLQKDKKIYPKLFIPYD